MATHTAAFATPIPAGQCRAATRFETLLNALPAGIVVLDGSGRVQDANPAAERLLGRPLAGEHWRDVAARIFQPNAAGEDLRLHNGRLVHLTTCPLGSGPGQILHFQDTTETRRLRERLEHSRRLVDMGRMAASLAHQLRTPLATALLYGSQLRRPELPADRRIAFADKLVERIRHLEQLIGNMLIFARGEAGAHVSFDVHELFQALSEWANEVAACRNIVLSARSELPAVSLCGNRILLQSALHNLVANALDAVDADGSVELLLCGSAELIEFVVRDNGPGIPPDQLERIFEPFHTTREGGNGLGLAVARAVARAHGGDVRVASEPGRGSRFILAVPRTHAQGATR